MVHIRDEYELRTAFVKEHNPDMSQVDVTTEVMKDADFYQRWLHWQWFKVDPGPTLVHKQAPLTYPQMLARVDARVAKATATTRAAAFMALAQEHPDQPEWYEGYRHYVLVDQPDDVAKAALDAHAAPPLTADAIRTIVREMLAPNVTPSMDFLKMR